MHFSVSLAKGTVLAFLLLEDVILCHCIPCYMQLGLKLFCLWNCMNSVRQIGSGCVAVCEVLTQCRVLLASYKVS